MLVYTNPDGKEKNINPFDHGSAMHTDIMKTQALKKALELYGFDAAFGGARRDEETSRAKERIISVRNRFHQWDPKSMCNQNLTFLIHLLQLIYYDQEIFLILAYK